MLRLPPSRDNVEIDWWRSKEWSWLTDYHCQSGWEHYTGLGVMVGLEAEPGSATLPAECNNSLTVTVQILPPPPQPGTDWTGGTTCEQTWGETDRTGPWLSHSVTPGLSPVRLKSCWQLRNLIRNLYLYTLITALVSLSTLNSPVWRLSPHSEMTWYLIVQLAATLWLQ